MVQTKRCARCGETKPAEAFQPSKQQPSGLFPYCRECKRAADRASYARHQSRRQAEGRARYAADPEPYKRRTRARYVADPAARSRESVDWARRNPEKRKQYTKRWQQANMQGKVRESTRRRYARRKGAPTIRFTPEQLAQRLVFYGTRCWICLGPFDSWDHVKPLAKGGWHCLANLRPICRRCNSAKGDRWPL